MSKKLAREVALTAVGRRKHYGKMPTWDLMFEVAQDAAQTLLLKLRRLHRPSPGGSRVPDRHCVGCNGDWPCDTARLIYTPEEL